KPKAPRAAPPRVRARGMATMARPMAMARAPANTKPSAMENGRLITYAFRCSGRAGVGLRARARAWVRLSRNRCTKRRWDRAGQPGRSRRSGSSAGVRASGDRGARSSGEPPRAQRFVDAVCDGFRFGVAALVVVFDALPANEVDVLPAV